MCNGRPDTKGVDTYRYHDNSNRLDFTDRLEETGPAETVESSRELIYNDAGRLFQLLEDGELKGEYLYNDQGQRTKKIAYVTAGTTTTTIYHYDQSGRLISETQEDGSPIKDYIYVNGRPVAQIDHEGATETIQYLHTDHLYTPRLATDRNQNVTWRWDGEAFGGDAAQELGARINLRFAGQYFDDESGLFYNWMRYYSPEIGRYITSDPIGLGGGLNTYGYVNQNPVRFIDPNGLFANVLIGGTIRVVGGRAAGAAIAQGLRQVVGPTAGAVIACVLTGYCSTSEEDDVADDSANDVPQQCDTDQARQKGDRFKSGDDPLQQLDEIEKAQRKVREGKSNQVIDSIEKSRQRARNRLRPHNIDLDDLDGF